jgi:ketosteroid isomerase-like protein
MNSTEENKALAREWLAAFNTRDLEGLLMLYDENARHYSPKLKVRQPETNGLIQGRPAMKKWWAEAFERLPTLRYTLKKLTADSDQVFIEYTRRVKDEEDLDVAEVLEIRNGRIIFSRVYHG